MRPAQVTAIRATGQPGTVITTAATDGVLRRWRLPGPVIPGAHAVFNAIPAGPRHTAVVAAGNGGFGLWNTTDPRSPTAEAPPLTGPERTVWSLAFAPDGTTLAAGTGDGTIWLWSTADPRHPQLSATLPAHTGQLFTVAFDPLNRNVLNGSTWSGWALLPGGGATTAAPAAVVLNGILQVFVQGTDTAVYRNVLNGSAWSGWAQVPGGGATPSGVGADVFSGTLQLFVQGTDNRIYRNVLVP